MSNYEQKYLKYKQKYLELKKLILKGGAICSLCNLEKAITHTCNKEKIDYSICAGCYGSHYRLVHCGINETCLARDGVCYEKIKHGNKPLYFYSQGQPLDEKCCNNPKSAECPANYGQSN
jgi:hypothetical protein